MRAVFQLPFHSQEEGADLDSIHHWLGDQSVPVSEDFASSLGHREGIDQVVDPTLVGWDVHRLTKIDLAIIRLTSYEIFYRPEIPIKVSISETVELTKKLSTDGSSRFINGILGSVIKKYESRIENRDCQ